LFVSEYNKLACQFIENFDYNRVPCITIIVGNKGLGKTLLLHELYNKVKNTIPSTIIIDAEKFASKFAYAAYKKQYNSFRKAYRNTKLFLLDNINSLKGKNKTINELFFTIDTILMNEGKVVITYRGQELNLDFLDQKFASRLKCGLTIMLKEPSDTEIKDFIKYLFPELNNDISLFDFCYERDFKKIIEFFKPMLNQNIF